MTDEEREVFRKANEQALGTYLWHMQENFLTNQDAINACRPELAEQSPSPLSADPFAEFSPSRMAGVAMHEMFKDMVAGGFTEDQALTILARMLAAHGKMKDG